MGKQWNGMSIKGALAILHPENNTLEGLKKAYHAAVKKWHPDVNKEAHDALQMTQAINDAYETLRTKIGKWEVSWGPTKSQCTGEKELFTEMFEIYNKIKHVPDAPIFRQGIFVCVEVEFKKFEDFMKGIGFHWHYKDKEWQWSPSWYEPPKFKGYRPWSKGQKVATYGRVRLENEPLKAVG